MSAFGGKANSFAGLRFRGRYWGQSGHRFLQRICLLLTQSGHRRGPPPCVFEPLRCLVLSSGGAMRRREFITLFCGGTSAGPLPAHSQQPPAVASLGLTSVRTDAYYIASFRKALSEAGFDDGRNVNIEHRFAEGDISRLPGLAAELVRRNVAIIFTATTVSTVAAKAATSTIPVVFAIGADPVKSGLVTSLSRPDGNLTGISFLTNQMEAKRLGLLHEIVPKVGLIAVLLNPNNPFFDNQFKDVDEASRALNLKVQIERASNQRDIASAFKKFEGL